MSDLSNYALALDPFDLDRYKEKLSVTLDDYDVILPDPYSLSSGWFGDQKKLPPTEYPAVYNYLIKMPGPITQEALQTYKSLNAYNYFKSGNVSQVKQHDIGDTCGLVYVKAFVSPDQRQNCAPLNPWICLEKESGYVVNSHCTCRDGLWEVCHHVAAVLFTLDNITRCGTHSQPACTRVKPTAKPTVKPTSWSDFFKKNISSVTADKLDISHPRHDDSHVAPKKRKTSADFPPMSVARQKEALRELAKILPNAAVCASVNSDTDSASENGEDPSVLSTHFSAD